MHEHSHTLQAHRKILLTGENTRCIPHSSTPNYLGSPQRLKRKCQPYECVFVRVARCWWIRCIYYIYENESVSTTKPDTPHTSITQSIWKKSSAIVHRQRRRRHTANVQNRSTNNNNRLVPFFSWIYLLKCKKRQQARACHLFSYTHNIRGTIMFVCFNWKMYTPIIRRYSLFPYICYTRVHIQHTHVIHAMLIHCTHTHGKEISASIGMYW